MTPEQEEQVRRALAAAARAEDLASGRTAGPAGEPRMPPEVVARLDDVLADLVAPRRATATPSTGSTATDELATRRRRRWPQVLVAAAATCVIAGAGAAVVTDGFGGGGGSADSTTAGSSREDGSRAAPQGPAPSARAEGTPSEPRSMAGKVRVGPALTTARLRQDVQRLVDRRPALAARGDSAGSPCTAPRLHPGERLIAVRLDGRLSSLVLGAPAGGTVQARVYSCADPGSPVATTEVSSAAP